MLTILVKNFSEDYQIFLNETKLLPKRKGDHAKFSCDLSSGKYLICIKKEARSLKALDILEYYISSPGEEAVMISRSASKVDVQIQAEVCHGAEEVEIVFDADTNKVTQTTGQCVLLKEECYKDEAVRRKLCKYIELPVMILGGIVFVPLWVVSVCVLITDFSGLSILLLALSSLLVVLWIGFIHRTERR